MSILKLPVEYNMLSDGSYKRKDINDFLVEGKLQNILDPPIKRKILNLDSDAQNNLFSIFGNIEEITTGKEVF